MLSGSIGIGYNKNLTKLIKMAILFLPHIIIYISPIIVNIVDCFSLSRTNSYIYHIYKDIMRGDFYIEHNSYPISKFYYISMSTEYMQ